MSNKVISLFPIATIILLGANVESRSTKALNEDMLQVAIIGASEMGYKTDVSIIVSFKKASTQNKVKIYKYKPLDRVYYQIRESKRILQNLYTDEFTITENYTYQQYRDVGLFGPRFYIELISSSQTLTYYFDGRYRRDFSSMPIIDTYDKEGEQFVSDANILLYKGKTDNREYVSEAFELTEYAKDALYEFDHQNKIDISEPLLTSKLVDSDLSLSLPLTCASTYLTFNDENKYLPYLHRSASSNLVTVLASLISDKQGSYFELNTDLYIDPNTRYVYFDEGEGRIKTKKLYFPLGIKKKENVDKTTNQFILHLDRVGFSKSRLTLTMNLGEFQNAIIGDCVTSDFCVTYEYSEPNFEIGEEIVFYG